MKRRFTLMATLLGAIGAAMVLATAAVVGSPLPGETAELEEVEDMTILEALEEDGRFTTLLEALEAAGLTEELEGEGPFTIFAPTDDRFDALPEGALDGLLEDTDALTDVLLYHVVDGEFLVMVEEVETLQGNNVFITSNVNEAWISEANIEASNGVIHVTEGVLMPEEEVTDDEVDVDEDALEDEDPEETEAEQPEEQEAPAGG